MPTTKPTRSQARKPTAEALAMLRDFNLKPGDVLCPILRKRSSSGMGRTIGLLLLRRDAKEPGGVRVYDLSYRAAEVLGWSLDKDRDGIKVSGCGMDMGFHLVYSLSSALFPNGFRVSPKTDHRNGIADGETDPDGGYALRSRWL